MQLWITCLNYSRLLIVYTQTKNSWSGKTRKGRTNVWQNQLARKDCKSIFAVLLQRTQFNIAFNLQNKWPGARYGCFHTFYILQKWLLTFQRRKGKGKGADWKVELWTSLFLTNVPTINWTEFWGLQKGLDRCWSRKGSKQTS